MNNSNLPEQTESANAGCVRRLVSTFNESFRDDDFTRTGIEINTKTRRVRIGWIGGYLPTFFYCGHLYSTKSGLHQKQLRVWRLAISCCANF